MHKKSRNRRSAEGTGAFANAPFQGLKGLKPAAAAPAAAKGPSSPPIAGAGEEEDLFLRAVHGARPLEPDADTSNAPAAEPQQAASAPVGAEESDGALFLQAMDRLGGAVADSHVSAPDEEPAPGRSTSGRMRQLRRGTVRISGELDLHGFPRDEALRRLGLFIAASSAQGLQAVLVITGKGTNSADGPVLQGAVASWLREQGRDMVAEFHPAPRDRGGSGAWVVFLKQRRHR